MVTFSFTVLLYNPDGPCVYGIHNGEQIIRNSIEHLPHGTFHIVKVSEIFQNWFLQGFITLLFFQITVICAKLFV